MKFITVDTYEKFSRDAARYFWLQAVPRKRYLTRRSTVLSPPKFSLQFYSFTPI